MEINQQYIYKHWNIKVNIPPEYIGCHKLCDRISTSVGLPYLRKHLKGTKLLETILNAAMTSPEQSHTYKLRNGGKIRLYAK